MFDDADRELVSVLPDVYVLWSSVCDAPIGYTFNRAAALEIRDEATVAAADAERLNKGTQLFNRAGTEELTLTREALARKYRSDEAYAAFVMTPQDVQVMMTNDFDGNMVWEPWAPGDAPEEFSRNFYNHYHSGIMQVPVTDTPS